jgi:hypothetical protein
MFRGAVVAAQQLPPFKNSFKMHPKISRRREFGKWAGHRASLHIFIRLAPLYCPP